MDEKALAKMVSVPLRGYFFEIASEYDVDGFQTVLVSVPLRGYFFEIAQNRNGDQKFQS